jgi:hypothetical protein
MLNRIPKFVVPALAAVAIATPSLAATPEKTAAPEQFSALQGVEAQALSLMEMDDIHGALTGLDLYNALVARAGLIKDDVIRQRTLDYLAANQATLVAFFDRLLALFHR